MGKYNIFQYTYYEYISYEFTKAHKIWRTVKFIK